MLWCRGCICFPFIKRNKTYGFAQASGRFIYIYLIHIKLVCLFNFTEKEIVKTKKSHFKALVVSHLMITIKNIAEKFKLKFIHLPWLCSFMVCYFNNFMKFIRCHTRFSVCIYKWICVVIVINNQTNKPNKNCVYDK